MKRRDLIETLEDMGCVLARHGGKHDWYVNAQRNDLKQVPRHNEINERLAKAIIKKLKDESAD